MKQISKRFSGETILIGGVGLFTYNIFNFSYRTYGKGGLDLNLNFEPELQGIAYYYHSDTLLMIAISAMLITLGILVIKNRQKLN